MPAVADTHAPGRGEAVEGLRGWLRHTITYLKSWFCCGCKGQGQCQVVGKAYRDASREGEGKGEERETRLPCDP